MVLYLDFLFLGFQLGVLSDGGDLLLGHLPAKQAIASHDSLPFVPVLTLDSEREGGEDRKRQYQQNS